MRLKYVHSFKDRHGRVRHYLRLPGQKRVVIEGDPGTAAFLKAYQAAAAAAEPAAPRPNGLPGTFSALVASYYQSAAYRQLRASTAAVYRRIIERIRAEKPNALVADLDAERIGRMMDARAETPAAANHVLRVMRHLMRHAVKERLRRDDPTKGIAKLRERGPGIHAWSEAEIEQFEARWPLGTRPRLALALLLYTGQRRSDVVRMGRQHVHGGAIEVRQQKTGTHLMIPIHAELRAAIDAMPPSGHLTFLVTQAGAAWTSAGFYNAFERWARAADLPPGRSPHGLRKAAARRLAEAGCSAHEIAAVTGHKTLAEVERYTRAADQARMAAAAMDRIGKPVATPAPRVAKKRK